LRELGRVKEAKEVLLQAEPVHGETCGLLHYNLACYHCLLGEIEPAKARMRRALKMDNCWKTQALDDPDLKGIWGAIAEFE
jgi:hypothetical protein